MKRLVILAVFILFYSFAQGQAGIYLTADDYLLGILEYKNDESGKHAIRTDIPFNPSAVKVKKGSEKIELDKWNVYGFKNKHNQDFRFYESKTYRIIDPRHFPIYAREVNVVKGKEKYRATRYYFSTHAEGPVVELNIRNLKLAFQNHDFHDMLDSHFSANHELLAFDEHYGEYKLKSVFDRTFN